MANQFLNDYAAILPTSATPLASGTTTGGWIIGTITLANRTSGAVSYTLYIYNGTTNIYISPTNAQVQPNGLTTINFGKMALNNTWILYALAGVSSALHVTASFNIVSP